MTLESLRARVGTLSRVDIVEMDPTIYHDVTIDDRNSMNIEWMRRHNLVRFNGRVYLSLSWLIRNTSINNIESTMSWLFPYDVTIRWLDYITVLFMMIYCNVDIKATGDEIAEVLRLWRTEEGRAELDRLFPTPTGERASMCLCSIVPYITGKYIPVNNGTMKDYDQISLIPGNIIFTILDELGSDYSNGTPALLVYGMGIEVFKIRYLLTTRRTSWLKVKNHYSTGDIVTMDQLIEAYYNMYGDNGQPASRSDIVARVNRYLEGRSEYLGLSRSRMIPLININTKNMSISDMVNYVSSRYS